jgi:hypothetical protein
LSPERTILTLILFRGATLIGNDPSYLCVPVNAEGISLQ